MPITIADMRKGEWWEQTDKGNGHADKVAAPLDGSGKRPTVKFFVDGVSYQKSGGDAM